MSGESETGQQGNTSNDMATTGDIDTGSPDDLPDTGDGGPGDATIGPCSGPVPVDYDFIPGTSYFGDHDYIEYIPGTLPLIISAPHGGTLDPVEIPIAPGLDTDGGSLETTMLLHEYLGEMTNGTPHIIINHLTRNRLNANRSRSAEPNAGNPAVERAWDQYHAYIRSAQYWVSSACARGHYIDMHTSAHAEGWVEMGIALRGEVLDTPDAEFNTQSNRDESSYRNLANTPGVSFIEIVRGPTSLGGLLGAQGIAAVPSPTFPGPNGGGYFTGGYSVRTHGSRNGGVIDGTQIENHFSHINSGIPIREDYARQLAGALVDFMEIHYGFNLTPAL